MLVQATIAREIEADFDRGVDVCGDLDRWDQRDSVPVTISLSACASRLLGSTRRA